jgi:NTP pyrophosphatase (non-canonical NTP hydrolase)
MIEYDSAPPPKVSPQDYGLALLTEECGEVLQLIGKAGRFGMDTPGVTDPLTGRVDMSVTPRIKLAHEAGDLLGALDYLIERGILQLDLVAEFRARKIQKLLDANSRDNLGRRLAP